MQFHHSDVSFGEIVVKWHLQIIHESEGFVFEISVHILAEPSHPFRLNPAPYSG